MSTETSAPTTGKRSRSADTALIDTDVHETLASIDLLLPYLAATWHAYTRAPFFMPGGGIPYNTSPLSRREWELPDGTAGTDLAAMQEHLFDKEGVSIAILNGFFHASSMAAQHEFWTAAAAAYNDWQIEHWLERDDRLRGSVHVVAHDPRAAAREIDRVAEHPQIVQVFLPLVTDRQYGDPFYRPIFEAAVRNQLPVTFHHGGTTQTVLGWPRYYVEWHTFAAPQAGMNQLMSLICGGLFDKYSELKVVFLEAGVAWVPWFMGRADQQYREFRREVPWVKRLPSEHMRDSVRIATQPFGDITPRRFTEMVEMTESERMFLFATDYPHYDADSAKAILPRTLEEGLRRKIRCDNAIETYPRLNVPSS